MKRLLHNPFTDSSPADQARPAVPLAWLRALAVGVAGVGGGVMVEVVGARLAVVGLVGGIGLAGLLRWWPGSALATLLIAAALNRFTVPGGGANIKPEHVAAAAVAGVLALRLALTPPGPTRPRLQFGPGLALLGLALYLGANLAASILYAPQPLASLRLVGLITLVAIPYGLMLNVVTGRAGLRQAWRLWLALGLGEAISGLVILFLWSRFGLDLGMQIVLNVPPVPVGTMREGNILGSYTGAAAVGLLAWLLTTPRRNYLWLGSLAGVVLLAGLAVSLSRGAWLGWVAGAALVGLVRLPTLVRRGAGLALAGLIVGPLLGFLASTPAGLQVAEPLWQRLGTLDLGRITSDITVTERLDTYEKAWEGITAHPILGNGTGSFGQRYVFRSVDEPGWVGNLELHLLYDSGLLGFAGFWLCIGAVGWRAARAYRRSRDPLLRAALLGLGGGLVTLLVAYQATEATWLAFTWVHLGLLAAATALVPGRQTTDDGRWTMDDGRRTTDDGRRTMSG